MIKIFLRYLLACTLPLTTAAWAGDGDLVDRLMVRSGMNTQIEQLPAMLEMGFSQSTQGNGIPADEMAQLQEDMLHLFTPASFKRDMRSYLADNLDKPSIAGALAWLESDLGRRITSLEEAASTPESLLEMQQQLGTLARDETRVRYAQRLDAATGATDSILSTTANVALAMSIPLNASQPVSQQMDIEDLAAAISGEIEKERANYEAVALGSFLYMYQSLSAGDIEKYIEFAESEVGRKYHAASVAAMNAAFIRHSRELGELIAGRMNARQQKL